MNRRRYKRPGLLDAEAGEGRDGLAVIDVVDPQQPVLRVELLQKLP